ncbi:MAG: hypothetical protein FMNOHCHN_01425 [Ignavibacteriaceae bacterium]|nr:hypothetical protein [Ignavibacteriaceae bacterium]
MKRSNFNVLFIRGFRYAGILWLLVTFSCQAQFVFPDAPEIWSKPEKLLPDSLSVGYSFFSLTPNGDTLVYCIQYVKMLIRDSLGSWTGPIVIDSSYGIPGYSPKHAVFAPDRKTLYFTDMRSYRMYKCRYNEETKEWGVPEMFYDNGFNVTSRWYCMNFPDDTTMFVVGEEKTKLARLRDGLWYPKFYPYEGYSYLFADGLWMDSTTLRVYHSVGTTNADLYVDYFEDTSYVGVQTYKLNISKISDSLYTLGEYQGRREKYPYLTKDRRKMVFQANYDGVFRYYISYLLVDENGDTILTSLKNDETLDQIDYSLNQNYPNPFNPITEIEFALPEQSDITLKVYDILGKEIATLASGSYSAGRYTVPFDGTNHASGVYIYKLSYGKRQSITKKMTLLK